MYKLLRLSIVIALGVCIIFFARGLLPPKLSGVIIYATRGEKLWNDTITTLDPNTGSTQLLAEKTALSGWVSNIQELLTFRATDALHFQLVSLDHQVSKTFTLSERSYVVSTDPDGQKIAYLQDLGPGKSSDIMLIDGESSRSLLTAESYEYLWLKGWSPSGRLLLYGSGDNTTYVFDSVSQHIYEFPINARRVMWTPGNLILYSEKAKGNLQGQFIEYMHSYIIDPLSDKQNQKELFIPDFELDLWLHNVIWSNDGHKAAIVSYGDVIYIYDMASHQLKQIVKLDGVKNLTWSPDDKYLAYQDGTTIGILDIGSKQIFRRLYAADLQEVYKLLWVAN